MKNENNDKEKVSTSVIKDIARKKISICLRLDTVVMNRLDYVQTGTCELCGVGELCERL